MNASTPANQTTLPQSSTTETGAPGSQPGMSPASTQLQAQIQQAFQNESTLANANITTNVTDDTIELSGAVPTAKDRLTAKRIAQSFAGNRKVVDRLTVTGKGRKNPNDSNSTNDKTPSSTNPNPNPNPNTNPKTNPKSQGDQSPNPR